MPERLSVATSELEKIVLKDGREIVVRKNETPRPKPGRTARHEAAHIMAAMPAGGIVEATIVPNGDSLGSARPVRMTAASAAAAGAMGYGGTGWDRFITENYLRVDWGTAKSAARAVLADKTVEIEEVAFELEEEKTISQHHVDKAIKRAGEKKQGIFPVSVEVYQSGRKVESFTAQSFHGEVKISQFTSLSKN
jgi:hypothetical protein